MDLLYKLPCLNLTNSHVMRSMCHKRLLTVEPHPVRSEWPCICPAAGFHSEKSSVNIRYSHVFNYRKKIYKISSKTLSNYSWFDGSLWSNSLFHSGTRDTTQPGLINPCPLPKQDKKSIMIHHLLPGEVFTVQALHPIFPKSSWQEYHLIFRSQIVHKYCFLILVHVQHPIFPCSF